jgi:UDP-N-acetylmuramate--alanine ligase
VITNIEEEHLDCYASIDEIKEAYTEYANRVPFYGAVVAVSDSPRVREILPGVGQRVVTCGAESEADYRAENVSVSNGRTRFAASRRGERLGAVEVPLGGMHNVTNALAAVAAVCETGITFADAAQAVGTFRGVKRRFEILGVKDGVTFVDDYAHHPSEITATLAGARTGGYARLVVLFQPHLYSRTRDFAEQFAESLMAADIVVAAIYGAREAPIAGVEARGIVERMVGRGHRSAHYVERKERIPEFVGRMVRAGDAVISMGAGDICEVHEAFLGSEVHG